MENIKRNLQTTNSRTEGSRKFNMCNPAGIGMERQRLGNFYKNTTRNLRLEWEC